MLLGIILLLVIVHLGRSTGHYGRRIRRFQGRQENIDGTPGQMTMFMSFPTKTPRPVGSFARRTHGRLGIKGPFDTIGLPLDHADGHGFVYIAALFVQTRVVDRHANVGGRPGSGGVRVADPTHVSRLEILFALFANRQPRVWELDVEFLFEAGRDE